MKIYAENRGYARQLFPHIRNWRQKPLFFAPDDSGLAGLAKRIFQDKAVYQAQIPDSRLDGGIFCVAFSPFSQYDLIVNLSGSESGLPHGLVCLAGAGRGFHGQRGRSWSAESGNLHLTIHWRPNQVVPGFGVGFPLLAAVSVMETLDDLPDLDGRSSTKWINDILIDGAKVAGFVTHLQSQENLVKAVVLGIGLNVETSPQVRRDAFVPKVTSVWEKSGHPLECSQARVLNLLLSRLQANYLKLCRGESQDLLALYRTRSAVLGKNVSIHSDSLQGRTVELARGRLERIGDQLELYIRGQVEPVFRGRLRLLD